MSKVWGKLRFLLLFFIILILGVFIFKNSILTYFLEKYASEANRARVEVDGLKLNLFKQTLTWDRLQVTDPYNTMSNIVDTGDLKFEIELKPLLKNSIVIDSFELDNVNFNTKRKKDGRIAGLEPKPRIETPMLKTFKEKLEQEKKEIPILDIKNLNSKEELEKLLEKLDIQISERYNEDKKYLDERVGYWKSTISKGKYEKDMIQLKNDIEKLRAELEGIDTQDALVVKEKLEKLNALRKKIDAVTNSIKEEKSQFEKEFQELEKRSENFSKVAQNDFAKITAFKDMGSENWKYVSEALFGESLTDAIYKFVENFEVISSKLQKGGAVEEETPYPEFWIKEGNINLVYQGLSLKGDIKNLVDDNVKIDRESIVRIVGESGSKKVDLDVLLDTRKKVKEFQISLDNFTMAQDFRNYYLKAFAGSNFDLLQTIKIRDGVLDLGANMNFDKINLSTVAGEVPIVNEKIKAIYLETIENVENLNFDIGYKNNGEFFNFDTNIDDILATNIKRSLSRELEKFQADLKGRFDSKVSSLQKELESTLSQSKLQLEERIKLIEGDVLKNVESLDLIKKELLKGSAGDGLDIFKKLK